MRLALLAFSGVAALNPIQRVAQLLEGLTSKLEADGKAEEKLYNKFKCWYETTKNMKTQSNAEASSRIETLNAYIDDIAAGRIEFTTERQDRERDLAELNAAIEKATALRAQEKADFEAAEKEMQTAITALTSAKNVLAAGTEGSTLLSVKFHLRRLARSKSVISTEDAAVLKKLLDVPEKDWKKLNGEATHKMKYKGRSLKLQELVAEMLSTFETQLADAQSAEQESVSNFETLLSSKNAEKAAAEEALAELKEENGARGLSLEEAQAEVDALTEQVSNDEKFITQVQEMFDAKKGEFTERKRLRMEEIKSISEAMSILRSDDSKDLFKKSFESQGYSFLQRANVKARRGLAARSTVMRAAVASHSTRMGALALSMTGGHFDEVVAAIDRMLTNLGEEETADLTKKEDCEEKRMTNMKEAKSQSQAIDEHTSTIDRSKAKIEELNAQIADAKKQISELNEQLAKATEQRTAENKEWQASDADDKEAVSLIGRAIDALESFYKNNNLALAQQPQFAVAAGAAPVPPPTTWEGGYSGAKGEHDGVVGILGMIKDDVEKDIATAKAAEDKSESEFQSFKSDTESSVSNLEGQINEFETQVGDNEDTIASNEEQKASTKESLAGTLDFLAQIRPGCDFFMVNFEQRKSNRQIEVDGLKKAKAILEGAKFD
jgi:hypothetical protein